MMVKCPECCFKREAQDNTIIAFCPVCLSKMERVDDGKKRIRCE